MNVLNIKHRLGKNKFLLWTKRMVIYCFSCFISFYSTIFSLGVTLWWYIYV